MKYRLFIESFLPEETACKIRDLQLKALNSCVNLISIENFHITYSFLGDTDENEIPKLKVLVSDFNRELAGIQCHYEDIIAFEQHGKSPIAVRLSFSKNISVAVEALQQKSSGDVKKFIPHITIGKARNVFVSDVLESYRETFRDNRISFPLAPALLAKSEISQHGSRYFIL